MAKTIICAECKEEKPYYVGDLCKTCYHRVYNRRWRKKNPDYKPPTIICIECGEERPHQARGLCKACYERWYYHTHSRRREMKRDSGLRWRHTHLEAARAHGRRHHWKHRRRRLLYNREWYRANRNEQLARHREWSSQNPDKIALNQARRRARERQVPETLTPQQAELLFCIGETMYPGKELHLDHIVPISKGGGTTLANMQAIPAALNLFKGDKLPREVYIQEELI